MNLYLLTAQIGEWPRDSFDSHLVRANSEQGARDLCPYADEGKAAWQGAKVEIITQDGEPSIIISSYNAS